MEELIHKHLDPNSKSTSVLKFLIPLLVFALIISIYLISFSLIKHSQRVAGVSDDKPSPTQNISP
jgi:hypothetical protein